MKTQSILFGTVGVLLIAAGIGCSSSPNNADRAVDNSTAASQPAPPPNDWTADRDAYISRRQQDLDELQQRWDLAKDKANSKSRLAWNETKEQADALRHDLAEAKASTKDTWDRTRQNLDEKWNRIENKTHDVFHRETQGS